MNGGIQAGTSLRSGGGSHWVGRFMDHAETYGPRIVEDIIRRLENVQVVLDLGAGAGRDLAVVRKWHPEDTLIAVEAGREYARTLTGKANKIIVANIERDSLPIGDAQADLIIANQVLEHTKEIFWIFHEVTRSLKIGGHFLFGVPNICTLHNRLLLLLGIHPTQHHVRSAHVRPFSRDDTLAFLNVCFPGGYQLISFRGAQHYPFPGPIARVLARAFPSYAFTIFFLIRKVAPYMGEFVTYPGQVRLETNFWVGDTKTDSQYWQ